MKTKILFFFSAVFAVFLLTACTSAEFEEFLAELDNPKAETKEKKLRKKKKEKKEKPKEPLFYAVSFHEVVRYPHEDSFEKELESLNGQKAVININPVLHTRHVKKVEEKPIKGVSGGRDLAVYLDKKGKMLWGQICFKNRYREVAMIVDGTIYRSFRPEHLGADPDDPSEGEVFVLVRGPFDKSVTEKIVSNSEKNYKKLSKE